MVSYSDDPGWLHQRLLLWPVSERRWVILTGDEDRYDEEFSSYSSMHLHPVAAERLADGVGLVEFDGAWSEADLIGWVRAARGEARTARAQDLLVLRAEPEAMLDHAGRRLETPTEVLMGGVRRRLFTKAAPKRLLKQVLSQPGEASDHQLVLPPDAGRPGALRVRARPGAKTVSIATPDKTEDDGGEEVDLHPGEGYAWVSLEAERDDQFQLGTTIGLSRSAVVRGDSALEMDDLGNYIVLRRMKIEDVPGLIDRVVAGLRPGVPKAAAGAHLDDHARAGDDDLRGIRDGERSGGHGALDDESDLRARLRVRNAANGDVKNGDEMRTLWVDYDSHGGRHKAWRDFVHEVSFERHADWPFEGERSAFLFMARHFEQHGGNGLQWLAMWVREKELHAKERTAIEMRVLVSCLHLSGTYDQLNGPCIAALETIARRVAAIVEAYAGDDGRPRWAGVKHYDGTTNALDCVDPQLRASVAKKNKEEMDMEALRSKTQSSESGGGGGRSSKDERAEKPDDGAVAGGGRRRPNARVRGLAPKSE